MLYKKTYIAMAVFLAISGGILTWVLLYGDLSHNSPVRAKQVFNTSDPTSITLSSINFISKYNVVDNVQTISEATSFN